MSRISSPTISSVGVALGLFISPGVGSAQTTNRPAFQAPIVSPEIQSDHRISFRLRATNAMVVSVSGQFQKGPVPMSRDTNGVWSVTVGPVAPDIYEYSFNVDGVGMIDPGNPAIKPMRNPRTSILEIPGEPPLPHDFQNVPHGRVSLHWYASKSLGRRRALEVYTPPGYDADPAVRFPVLYLFHGAGDNEATWVAHGRAHWILDNLLAQQKAKPMLIVMLDGHAAPFAPGAPRNANLDAFERDLLEDAMPLVEAEYRIRTDAASRAILGLSMGGGQSLNIGLRHPDRFAWVGGMSSAVGEPGKMLSDVDALNRDLKLLWFACGKDDFLLKQNREFDALLKERGVKHEYVETEGDHSWPVWRRYLVQFLPRIF